jgi:hypothetical protein
MKPIPIAQVHEYCQRVWSLSIPQDEPVQWTWTDHDPLEFVLVGGMRYTTDLWVDEFLKAKGKI